LWDSTIFPAKMPRIILMKKMIRLEVVPYYYNTEVLRVKFFTNGLANLEGAAAILERQLSHFIFRLI
jgi:hypothetical protein